MNWDQRKVYVNGLVTRKTTSRKTSDGESRREGTFEYSLPATDGKKLQVCRTTFLNTLCLGSFTVQSWVKKAHCGVIPSQEVQNTARVRTLRTGTQHKLSAAGKFLNDIPKLPSHYARKDSSKLYLEPIFRSLSDLYSHYKEYCAENGEPIVCRFTFEKLFKDKNLSLYTLKKDMCDVCSGHAVGNINTSDYEQHIKRKDRARLEKENDKKQALTANFILLSMDLEAVKVSPYLTASALYFKTKLTCHNFTVYDLITHQASCYWFDETSADLTASTFASFVIDYLERYCLPKGIVCLVIYSDGCTYQNRNNIMANALLNMSVEHNVSITQKYLEPSHTQMECDSVHATIERKLKNREIHVPSDFISVTKEARKKPTPYEAIHVDHSFVKDYSDKSTWSVSPSSIRPGRKDGDTVIVDIRALSYNRQSKVSNEREVQVKMINETPDCDNTDDSLIEVVEVVRENFENVNPDQVENTMPEKSIKTMIIDHREINEFLFTDNDGYCNAYITCASTGKAAVAIDGTTVHTALKISLSKLLPLSSETLQLYRSLFRYVRVLIINEISMVSAELLHKIDNRLKQITGKNTDFGSIDVILIGDLRQLPPVRSTPIYKTIRTSMIGPHLRRKLKFYQLTTVMRQANVAFSQVLTKIGNGDVLDEHEFQLIESRFFKNEDVATLCPDGVRLFFLNEEFAAYSNLILSQCENKVLSTSVDVIIGAKSAEQEANFRLKLHKKSVIDTGGLPYHITFVVGKHYVITTNIDVTDGLCNGAVGKLVHLEFDESNTLIRVWLEFCGSDKVDRKKRQKAAALAVQNRVGNLAVPIELRTVNISLASDRKCIAKRKHFPLTSALALTIHKSQGGTFDEIVYEYSKAHSQELVYVALSRVTSIEKLYITTKNDNSTFKFYHNRKQAASTASLLQEFKRLSLNSVQTIAKSLLDFISNRNGISIMTFNCQSLNSHKYDLQHSVTRQTNVLLLTETCMTHDNPIEIPNFNCIVQFKRDTVPKGGVAIYQNKNDITNIMTPNIEINIAHVSDVNVRRSVVGDICACLCKLRNGLQIVMVAIYISPNPKLDEVEHFIHRTLLEYTEEGSKILGTNGNKIPLILAGDFNINFADKKSERLTTFLSKTLKLKMNNDPQENEFII
ncbi:unnamed protein product [Arctia plantaginis]|uniref:ATP-dependent DNA helicase n=1 Tax=Arctia plantaginis TaxID=874455 RepID=A0A8S0Z9U1_ARCPL|nr:unnamed protein product [Arctia plantaginis]